MQHNKFTAYVKCKCSTCRNQIKNKNVNITGFIFINLCTRYIVIKISFTFVASFANRKKM